MRVAAYYRVSTKEQSIQQQKDYIKDYCVKKGFEIVKEYKDEGVSGSVFERPGLNRLFKDADGKLFSAVVIYKLDRFGRSARDLLNGINELKDRSVDFISISDNIDTTTPYGKLMLTLLAGFAEFERDLMLERTQLGLARARKYGTRSGKPMHRPKKELPMKEIVEFYNKQLSMASIGRIYNVSRHTVRNRLKEEGVI